MLARSAVYCPLDSRQKPPLLALQGSLICIAVMSVDVGANMPRMLCCQRLAIRYALLRKIFGCWAMVSACKAFMYCIVAVCKRRRQVDHR